MNNTRSNLRWVLILSIVLQIALVWPPISAASAAESFTVHLSNVTQTVQAANSCVGPVVATLTYDAVFHVTEVGDTYHVVRELHGSAVVVPEDPNEPSFSGNFAETRVLEFNRNNAVNTIIVTQLDPQMKFHVTFHLVFDESGSVELFVLNVACGP